MHIQLTYLLLLLIVFPYSSSSCGHDEFQARVPQNTYSDEIVRESRKLQSPVRESLRMVAFHSLGALKEADRKIIHEQFMPAAISYYQATLKVNRFGTLKIKPEDLNACQITPAPKELIDGVEADFAVWTTILPPEEESTSTYWATASTCMFHPNNRPKLAIVRFTPKVDWSGGGEMMFEMGIYLLLHELGHALGFSKHRFANFIDPNTNERIQNPTMIKNVNGQEITILQTEPLRQKVRDHFGCQSLEGAYIEQEGKEGSAGSHLERRVFFNDVITASVMQDGRISEIFLAALVSSGWYSADYLMAEPLDWGKDKGCDFVEKTCLDESGNSRFPEYFCTPQQADNNNESCDFGRKGHGVCRNQDTFSDSCPYYIQYNGRNCQISNNTILFPGESFGTQSMCFGGNFVDPYNGYCFKQTCQTQDSSYRVVVTIGNQEVICVQAGALNVPGYTGKTLTCPDPKTFCTTSAKPYCVRGCMGRGVCKENGVCECYKGYSGPGCSYRGDFVPIEGDFNLKIDDDDNSFNFMAIPIGIGIIAVVAFIGLLVTKIQAYKKRRSRQSENVNANSTVNLQLSKSNNQTTIYRANMYQSVSVADNVQADPGNIELKIVDGNQYHGQLRAAALRQEALRSNLGRNREGNNPLSVLRGIRE